VLATSTSVLLMCWTAGINSTASLRVICLDQERLGPMGGEVR